MGQYTVHVQQLLITVALLNAHWAISSIHYAFYHSWHTLLPLQFIHLFCLLPSCVCEGHKSSELNFCVFVSSRSLQRGLFLFTNLVKTLESVQLSQKWENHLKSLWVLSQSPESSNQIIVSYAISFRGGAELGHTLSSDMRSASSTTLRGQAKLQYKSQPFCHCRLQHLGLELGLTYQLSVFDDPGSAI